MTVSIGKTNRTEISRLISSTEGIKLNDQEKRMFDRYLLATSSVWVGMVDSKLVCTWGLIPPTMMSDIAYLWLYTTENVKSHEFLFIRHSQRMVEKMLEEYPILTGHTTCGWDQTIRWLRWLGAEFGDPQGKLLPFVIRKK